MKTNAANQAQVFRHTVQKGTVYTFSHLFYEYRMYSLLVISVEGELYSTRDQSPNF